MPMLNSIISNHGTASPLTAVFLSSHVSCPNF